MAAVTTPAWLWVTAGTPSPGPSPSPVVRGPDPDLVTPGVAGFLVVFLLAVATIFLLRSMTGHLRKVRYSPDPAAEDDATPAGDAGEPVRNEPETAENGPGRGGERSG
jgi:hypothetical protein